MSCAGNHDESRVCDRDAAFSDYVPTRGTALLRMATMLTGNRADAEDLVQAALAKTYRAWSKINDHAALDAYVRRALDRLPQRMRTAVMLGYFEDMTEPEIAAALGISLGTVKSTVSRAVAKLRIDAEFGEDSGALLSATLRLQPHCALRCPGPRYAATQDPGYPAAAPHWPLQPHLGSASGPEQLIPMIAKRLVALAVLSRSRS
jgi:Sigma-70, region 4